VDAPGALGLRRPDCDPVLIRRCLWQDRSHQKDRSHAIELPCSSPLATPAGRPGCGAPLPDSRRGSGRGNRNGHRTRCADGVLSKRAKSTPAVSRRQPGAGLFQLDSSTSLAADQQTARVHRAKSMGTAVFPTPLRRSRRNSIPRVSCWRFGRVEIRHLRGAIQGDFHTLQIRALTLAPIAAGQSVRPNCWPPASYTHRDFDAGTQVLGREIDKSKFPATSNRPSPWTRGERPYRLKGSADDAPDVRSRPLLSANGPGARMTSLQRDYRPRTLGLVPSRT